MGEEDDTRTKITMQDCPFCDAAGPHYAGDDGRFGCTTCSMWFEQPGGGDGALGPNWLPR